MSATNATAASCRNFRSPRAERTAYCSPILILEIYIYIYINVAIRTTSELRVCIEIRDATKAFFRLSLDGLYFIAKFKLSVRFRLSAINDF